MLFHSIYIIHKSEKENDNDYNVENLEIIVAVTFRNDTISVQIKTASPRLKNNDNNNYY